MASKFVKKIKLMQKVDGKYEPKQFSSAEFLPGSVLEEALDLQFKLEETATNNDKDGLKETMREIYAFIGESIYEGQFTGEDYINGLDAREVMTITRDILGSVTQGHDSVYADQKKK